MFWDPDPSFITLPLVGRPIAWYGVLFALGFLVGYYITRWQVRGILGDRKAAGQYTDRLLWVCILGTVIGARLGHVFFYSWPRFRGNLLDIFKVWEGGLSSHGAAVGVTVALVICYFWSRKRYPAMTFLRLLDLVTLTTALIAVFIRVGNFVNQELVGIATSVPWAVTFGHPAGGLEAVARHPVQLYEAAAYGGIFLLLLLVRRRSRPGLIGGLFLTLVFGARLCLEVFKTHQSLLVGPDSLLSMGQWLSLPMIAAGLGLILYSYLRAPEERSA